jgi:hypothetical protein
VKPRVAALATVAAALLSAAVVPAHAAPLNCIGAGCDVVTSGNQQITLTTPPNCVPMTSAVAVHYSTVTIAGAPKLRFTQVSFFIGPVTAHPNLVAQKPAGDISFPAANLRAGGFTLHAVFDYKRTVRKHHHKKAIKVTRILKVNFFVC